jgi:hypothetical protein
MDSQPSCPGLTPDDRLWRVDWFGESAYPAGVRRYAQPSIRVVLSPLLCEQDNNAALLGPSCSDHHHQHEAWVPVAQLPLLAIGDLWQNGRRVASPDYQVERFHRLRITPETTAFVKAGLAIEEHFLIPLGPHPWHAKHTQSYCVSVALDKGKRLLVPCVELIRFYFGSSSNLLKRLFIGPLQQDMLWASKRFNKTTRHLHLVLADRLSGASAADIGRIAESKLAWRAAAGIYASCQKATVQRLPAHPYTGFPFDGETDLEAHGIWLPFGEQLDSTFLVYRLKSCSFPFPFWSLSYEASNQKARWNGKDAGGSKGTRYGQRRQLNAERAVDLDPGNNKMRRSGFGGGRKFPDLERKQVWRDKLSIGDSPDVFMSRPDGSLEQVAFGDGNGSSTVAGLDTYNVTVDARESGVDMRLPRFVSVALKDIAESKGFPHGAKYALIRAEGQEEFVFKLPLVVDEEGELDPRLLYSKPGGGVRQRRACYVEEKTECDVWRRWLILEGRVRGDKPTTRMANELTLTGAVALVIY